MEGFSVRSVFALCAGFALAIGAMVVFRAWRADAAPGDDDMTFVPITPCRLLDTRPGSDHVGNFNTLGPQDALAVLVANPRDQGNCPLLGDFNFLGEALQLNVTAVGATEPTFITIYPTGALPPTSTLNPAPGEPPTPNAVAVALAPIFSGCRTCTKRDSFSIYNHAGKVDVIIDVMGFYARASMSSLNNRVAELERHQNLGPKTWFADTAEHNRVADLETVLTAIPESDTGNVGPPLGTITVNYTVNVVEPDPGESVRCWIGEGFGRFNSIDGSGTLSATTAWAADGPVSISLLCESSNGADITSAWLNATFTPD
jgi:hypothetical protein